MRGHAALEDKVVVVTGASAGVGRASARAFARAGAHVGLIARDPERLEAARVEIEALGRRAWLAALGVVVLTVALVCRRGASRVSGT